MKKRILIVLGIILSFFLFRPSVQAKVYKYIDEKGTAHYTNVPVDRRFKPASGSPNSSPKSPKKKGQKPGSKQTPDKNPRR